MTLTPRPSSEKDIRATTAKKQSITLRNLDLAREFSRRRSLTTAHLYLSAASFSPKSATPRRPEIAMKGDNSPCVDDVRAEEKKHAR